MMPSSVDLASNPLAAILPMHIRVFALIGAPFLCLLLGIFPGIGKQSYAQGFYTTNNWIKTATDGSGLQMGQAITLTWGFVADDTPITAAGFIAGDSNDPSELIQFLDGKFGSGEGGSDLTNRPWFSKFESSFNRWSEISGVSFAYESADNGADIRSFPDGKLGEVADMRIGGHAIGGNTIAYAYYPQQGFKSGGDMVFDTDSGSFFDNDQRFRNTIMHEIGHGFGIEHLVSNDSQFLMEPNISAAFDGPQFADVLAANRLFGDKYEKAGGNDSIDTATLLEFEQGTVAIGLDATDKVVAITDVDFVSIDGDDDQDFFQFDISGSHHIEIELNPLGPTYNARRQSDSEFESFDTSAMNDLNFTLFDADGTILNEINQTGLGESEFLSTFLVAGSYYIRVAGDPGIDQAQFYSLSVVAMPEPESFAVLSIILAFGVVYARSRRQKRGHSAFRVPC